MEKRWKQLISACCLCAMLFLSACGKGSQGETQPPVPAQPESTAAPVVAEPSPTPESTAAPVVTEPSAAPESTAAPVSEELPIQPAAQTEEEPGPAANVQNIPDQNPQAASGSFTGAAGTEFVVPEGFIQLDETPAIGYQYTFWHPDYEIRIVVYEIAPGSVPEGAYETDYQIAAKNPDVTYFNHGNNWFVQSGYNQNGEEIFYSKESSTDTGLKSFWITYPTAKREFGDSISAEFEKGCHF